jgi:hypothetical protein
MAVELAERRGIALAEARARLREGDLAAPAAPAPAEMPEPAVEPEPEPEDDAPVASAEIPEPEPVDLSAEAQALPSPEEHEARELEMSFEELAATPDAPDVAPEASDADVLTVLENGVREISGEVRNSLDFHRSQDGGGEVSHVVLSGAAQDIPGFAEALQLSLGVEVRPAILSVAFGAAEGDVSPHRLAVATGLAAAEAPQ